MADFYKFEIANWNEGTANLTLEQEAAYLRVVNAIRLADQPITFHYRVLCGLWRCDIRVAKRLLKALIDAGKLRIEGDKIVNDKAVLAAKSLVAAKELKRISGASGGKIGGKSPRKPLENNDVGGESALSRSDQSRADQIEEENRRPSNTARESSDPPDPDDDDQNSDLEAGPPEPELRAMLAAGGIANPTAADIAEARRWRLLGLPPERIRPVLEAVRRRAPEPPRIAAYFGPEVERLASQPPAEPPLSDEAAAEARLRLLAQRVLDGKRVFGPWASHEHAAALISRGTLTGWDEAIARGFEVDRSRIPRTPRPAAE